ncbi:hypothetical protein [Leisingera sp. MMG026]|uniref:hypothetical protein n=1 Tax=Leisingera sp. MMG026 TaxID=2909982 RepID=UPI001F391315|nr:hypothetical protein [Leisingera sp. MMG026]MCF6433546.1 hypothetical protein [Leisingera sp. MMG026]
MRRWLLIGTAVIALSGVGGAALMSSMGAFNSITTQYDAACTSVGDMAGPEDLAIDYDAGVAFISSLDRRAGMAGDTATGAIHRLDLDGSNSLTEMNVTGLDAAVPFLPHGVDLKTIGGTQYLFALNHRSATDPAAGHDIFVFEVRENTLDLVEHYQNSGIRSPNDLAAIDLNTVYFSNDRGKFGNFANLVEMMLAQKIADVSVYDQGEVSLSAPMAFANGVATIDDGKTVYATAMRESVLKEFKRNPATNTLTLVREISVGEAPDNISVAEDGSLWVASHLNLMAFDGHIKDASALSPFQVYRVDPATGDSKLMLENDGSLQSSVSVAAPYKDKILLGTAFQSGIKVCPL